MFFWALAASADPEVPIRALPASGAPELALFGGLPGAPIDTSNRYCPDIACLMDLASGSETVMSAPQEAQVFPMLPDSDPAKPDIRSMRSFATGTPGMTLATMSTPKFCMFVLCMTVLTALLSSHAL